MKIAPTVRLMACALALSSCTFYDYVVIANETTTGVLVKACGREERVGDGLLFTAPARCLFPLRITSSYGTWSYVQPSSADLAVLVRPGMGREIRLKLASDGALSLAGISGWQDKAAPAAAPLRPIERGRIAGDAVEPATLPVPRP